MAPSPTKIVLRDANPNDYPTFAELFLELADGVPVMSRGRFCTEMVAHTVIAEVDDSSVGYAFFRPLKDLVHLSNLVTAPAARRQGIGQALLTEVARRARALGCSTMTLNVVPTNLAAVRLYESVGLTPIRTNRQLKIEWAKIDALAPEAAPFVSDVCPIDEGDDDTLEREHDLARGLFAEQRSQPGRVLRMIRNASGTSSLGAFDTTFGGVFPIRASDTPHALSLLRALRQFALPNASVVLMPIEGHPELADGLIAAGAVQRTETLFMRGPLGAMP